MPTAARTQVILTPQVSMAAHACAAAYARAPNAEPVTRSLQFRARFETRPTQAYDLTVMIEWS